MVTPRKRKAAGAVAKTARKAKTIAPAGKSGPTRHKSPARAAATKVAKSAMKGAKTKTTTNMKPAKSIKAGKPQVHQVSAQPPVAKTAAARKPSRPASVKTAAKAVAAARASAAKRRAPSYIPRSSFHDDWMLGGPAELPRQPNPAAHTPVRKPPKPRAPKPKAISHEQAVANLKALLESRKRKDRGGAGVASGKSA